MSTRLRGALRVCLRSTLVLALALASRSNPPSDRVAAFDRLLSSLQHEPSHARRHQRAKNFMEEQKSIGFPLIGESGVIFTYWGAARDVQLIGNLVDDNNTGIWRPKTLSRLDGTPLHYIRFDLHRDAISNYGFRINGDNCADPANAQRVKYRAPGGGVNYTELSVITMPEFPAHQCSHRPLGGGQGKTSSLRSLQFTSALQPRPERRVQVYLPPGFDPSGKTRYPSLYVADGGDYLAFGASQFLDCLIATGKIPSLIAVFVDAIGNASGQFRQWRTWDYSNRQCDDAHSSVCWQNYARVIVDELVPLVDSEFPTQKKAGSRAHVGLSFGGFVSAYVALHYPETFRLAGLQEPTFFYGSDETLSYLEENPPAPSLRFYVNSGRYDDNYLQEDIHRFVVNLKDRGVTTLYRDFHASHDPALWQATFAEMVEFLFGGGEVDYDGAPVGSGWWRRIAGADGRPRQGSKE